jgi:DNA-binding NarL/FixJ family response regulator
MMRSEPQVVIVDDHPALRRGVELLLTADGLRVTGVAESASEAARMILARRPDVALVDIGLERGSGLEVTRSVLSVWAQAGILLYTGGSVDPDTLRDALASGARGIALKAGAPSELTSAIRAVAAGGEYVDPRLARLLDGREAETMQRLSPREREILELLVDGMTGEEIADHLVLSPQTVQTHVRNLMRKLGARTRVHAVAIALRSREIALNTGFQVVPDHDGERD